MEQVHKWPHWVRRAALRGKETVAPEAKVDVAKELIQLYGGGFVLIVPLGTRVHEALL